VTCQDERERERKRERERERERERGRRGILREHEPVQPSKGVTEKKMTLGASAALRCTSTWTIDIE
jgi:hypothetical protein